MFHRLVVVLATALLAACAADSPTQQGPDSIGVPISSPTTASAAPATTTAAPAPAAKTAATTPSVRFFRKNGTEVTCRLEPAPNSRLRGVKICMTREEWEQRATVAGDALTDMQRSGTPDTGD